MATDDFEIVSFSNSSAWEKWLEKNHAKINGVWMRFYKKGSNVSSITYKEALDVALCFGWIDSQVKKYDEISYLQKFTPRRSKSIWSKNNTQKAGKLINQGKMKPSGFDQISLAKQDGRWQAAYDSRFNCYSAGFSKSFSKK